MLSLFSSRHMSCIWSLDGSHTEVRYTISITSSLFGLEMRHFIFVSSALNVLKKYFLKNC